MLTCLARRWGYSAWHPLRSLERAIAAEQPDVIVPCDDRAARHLYELHALRPDLGALIERSLGNPASYRLAERRATLLSFAAAAGVAVPPTETVSSEADLRRFAETHPFPWVLKLDGSWGGRGVNIVEDFAGAVSGMRALRQGSSLRPAGKKLLVNRDPFPVGEWRPRAQRQISVQAFVAGRPANCLTVCRDGEVLSEISVEVLSTTDPTGAATIVRLVDDPDMSRAARDMVRRLGVSGFCGFDFMLDHASGKALLIEMNARATQLGHLPLGDGHDLVAAFMTSLCGRLIAPAPPLPAETIALFPGAMRQAPPSPYLPLAYHDLPFGQPALLRELERMPWENRSLASRLAGWWQRCGTSRPAKDKPARLGARQRPRTTGAAAP